MPKSFGVVFLVALAFWALLGMFAGRALGNHIQCGDVITQDTTLDSDLVDCPGDGIVIGADGITLDLNGHTIDGDGDPRGYLGCDTGILNGRSDNCTYPRVPGHSGVTIRNGLVRQFALGLQLVEGDANAVLRLRLSESSGWAGISGAYLSNAVIADTEAVENRGTGMGFNDPTGPIRIVRNLLARNAHDGIEVSDGDASRIEDNVAFGNGNDGIRLNSTEGSLVRGNRTFVNGGEGMEISDGVLDNVIAHNRSWRNAKAGILLEEGAHRNRVVWNLVFENSHGTLFPEDPTGGIVIWEGHDDVVADNQVAENGGDAGIAMEGVHDSVIARNHVTRNTADGIALAFSFVESNVLMKGNRALENGDDGLDIEVGGTTLTRNLALRNLDLGIEAVPDVVDGGANLAFRNGNPLQCLNVDCRRP
jgi:parallel beta-helix repeat protein